MMIRGNTHLSSNRDDGDVEKDNGDVEKDSGDGSNEREFEMISYDFETPSKLHEAQRLHSFSSSLRLH